MPNPKNPSTITRACADIITRAEGLRLQAYLCPRNILTIGWGHVLLPKFDAGLFGQMTAETLARLIDESQKARQVTKEAKMQLNINRDQALTLLQKDVAQAALFIHSVTPVALNQHQFDALVSFVFNIGQGQYAQSTLRKKLNAGDYPGAAAELPRWNKATDPHGNKITQPGLVTRRAKERALFETPA